MQVGKSHSFLFHSTCIFGLEVYPTHLDDSKKPVLPSDSFISYGSDDTVRYTRHQTHRTLWPH